MRACMSKCVRIECNVQYGCMFGSWRGGRITVLAIKLQWLFRRSVCLVHSSVVRRRPPQSAAQSSSPRLPAENTHTGGIDADETPCCVSSIDGQGTYEYVCVGAVGVPVAAVDAKTA